MASSQIHPWFVILWEELNEIKLWNLSDKYTLMIWRKNINLYPVIFHLTVSMWKISFGLHFLYYIYNVGYYSAWRYIFLWSLTGFTLTGIWYLIYVLLWIRMIFCSGNFLGMKDNTFPGDTVLTGKYIILKLLQCHKYYKNTTHVVA